MTWNFVFNNLITYRDQRLRGAAFVAGLASFYAIGAVGAFANIGIAQLLFEQGRELVARRHRRRAHRRRVELHDVELLHLAPRRREIAAHVHQPHRASDHRRRHD